MMTSFGALVDEIYGLMTGRDTRPPAHIWTQAAPGEGLRSTRHCRRRVSAGCPDFSRFSWPMAVAEDLPS